MNTETKTPLQFVVSYETTTTYTDESAWLTDLDNAYTLHAKSGWHFADVLHRGVSQLQKRRDKTDLYQLAHDQTRVSIKRMQNLVSMMNKPYAKQAQDLGLEIAHVEAVLGLDDDEAEAMLLDAAEQSITANAIGGILRERRLGKIADVPAVGNEDDEPPFTRAKGNVLYESDDLDAKADALADSVSAYDFTDDTGTDIDDMLLNGNEFAGMLQRAAHKLVDKAKRDEFWNQQRSVEAWYRLAEQLIY